MGIIDKTRYGIIMLGTYTASGHAELQATFTLERIAVEVLKQYVPNAKERKHRYKIVRLADLPADTKWIDPKTFRPLP